MTTRKKYSLIILLLIFSIATTYLLFTTGMNITYEKQAAYFDNVRTIASIIFGVTGAWLAISYPKALSSARYANEANSINRKQALLEAEKDIKILTGFIEVMVISIIIIAASLAIPFIKETVSNYQWALDIKEYLRGATYSFLGIISIAQLGLLLMTLKNTYHALTELQNESSKATTKVERDQNKDL